AGAGMMRTPAKVARVFKEVRKAVQVPLTAKLRLGWDEDSLNYRGVAEIAVENGAAAIALHGRTAKMAYTGKARWAPIAELKALLPVPVIGNGDVLTTADASRLLAETGCDAAMIGRGAKLNPWIFSWRDRQDVTPEEVYALIRYQYAEMVEVYPFGAIMAFRKFLKAYLEPYQFSRDVLRPLLTCTEESVFFDRIDQVFSRLDVTNLTKPSSYI
ncbi:MAG: tRNA-dihydrouridine synthase family protein, partial [Anaerolineaceae bacterium]